MALSCAFVVGWGQLAQAGVFRTVAGQLHVREDERIEAVGLEPAVVPLAWRVKMRVEPGTVLYPVNKSVRLWLHAKGRTPSKVIALRSGRIEIEAQPEAGTAIMVRTGHEVATVVERGKMTVIASPEEIVIISHSGRVLSAVGAGRFSSLENARVRVISGSGQQDIDPPAPPEPKLKYRIFGGFGGSAELRGVDWQPTAGASRYHVSIERLDETGQQWTFETAQPRVEAAPRLPAGHYALAVRTVDTHGVEGAWSSPEEFNVLGVQTSEGGYVDGRGNIVAGYDGKLRLTHAEGLLMKGLRHQPWKPVPEEIVLSSNEPMNIHLRQAGDSYLVSTQVRPQTAGAEVEVGPKRLTWPGQAARIRVELYGEADKPPPAWIEPRFRVLLGIDELEVSWARSGSHYFAQVPPQPGEGPWVVRVEVEDQFGHALGRDFLEISPPKAPAKTAHAAPSPPAASDPAPAPEADDATAPAAP